MPSSSSSSSSSKSSNLPNDMESPSRARKLVKKLKRGIRHMSHIGPHSKSADRPATVQYVADIPVLNITFPLSPKTKTSCDSMASSTRSDPLSMSDSESRLQVQPESSAPPDTEPGSLESNAPPAAEPDSLGSTLDDSRFETTEPEGTSSHAQAAEPEVPDPFLVDDDDADESHSERAEGSEEAASETEAPVGLSVDTAQQSLAVAEEVSLAQPPSDPLSTPAPDTDKAVPPPPAQAESEDEDEEESPELYLPGLILPTMFHPIPNTDPLTVLLTKYIPTEKRPVRDVSGNWQGGDFNTLVMTNSWRALARMARDRLVEADPEDVDLMLSLWYIRLASLARLRLFSQTSAECTGLFTVLKSVEPAGARAWLFDRKLPFELEVLHARLSYWAGDHMGYLDALAGLLRRCKAKAREAHARHDANGAGMWKERGARVCLIIASQLVEMKDFSAAAKLLEPLCKQGDVTSPYVQAAVGRIYLQGGYIAMAMKHFAAVAQDSSADPSLKAMNNVLLASANGDWPKAIEELKRMLTVDPENFVAINNLSVALLSQGHIQEGIRVLEEAVRISPSATLQAEPFLFNLSTMYELRSTAGVDKKRSLLIEVAKWAGDGLRTTCLKMPAN